MCSHLPVGSRCSVDRSCESGVCLKGSCVASPQEDSESCDTNQDCKSRRCAKQELLETAPLVCCPNGRAELTDVSWTYRDELICSESGAGPVVAIADDQTCTDSGECENYACGLNSYSETAGRICCSKGESYSLPVGWSYGNSLFCGNLPDGTLCGDNRMCSSGSCIDGQCSSQLLADGATCTQNSDCESTVCARAEFLESATQSICCPGGEAHSLRASWTYSSFFFCGNRPVGTICGSDDVCASKLCIGGTCVDEPLMTGETCTKYSDCSGSIICGRSSFTENAEKQCCTLGQGYFLDTPWSYQDDYFCGELADGSICGLDKMCASGHCIEGLCRAEKVSGNATCTKDTDW